MPHFVIEDSDPIMPAPDIEGMITALHEAASRTDVLVPFNIKLRAIGYRHFRLNDSSASFVHLTVSLLECRTPEHKEGLAIACRAALVATCPQADAISVDIRDMEAFAYKKTGSKRSAGR